MSSIAITRVRDPHDREDRYRVLVDGLRRVVGRDAAAIDESAKDLAPSDALRRWFNHDPSRWTEFGSRYRAESHDRIDELDADAPSTRRHQQHSHRQAADGSA